jgi:hypothetical protein
MLRAHLLFAELIIANLESLQFSPYFFAQPALGS